MDEQLERRLRELLDKQEITEIIYKNARAVDRRDAPLMSTGFHPDATDDHGMFQGKASDFVPWVMEVLSTMEMTQHVVGNVLIRLDGDQATSESYFIAHHLIKAENGAGIWLGAAEDAADQFMVAGGRYLDRFEKQDGEWRIVHRHAVFDWNTEMDSTEKWDRDALDTWVFGKPAPHDASYQLLPTED
ncbi:hypothetical protein GCM10011371_25690 [Novosphingobium marinum]|uniref:SnoaL-like domain-containing protein n=1 Tax=Novosphingobium marinum TaxID=1514948 RepID=A0A7Y9XXC5_9SPHN|nr:nuclear transport factor 2 family protein [Novosphingobium marinum]NYH94816.1 hypothetical protein [Novosphingobium marinum]GGC37122.1 hypothetical protein GCM10011371_25690 [Novosphingobium marinum]